METRLAQSRANFHARSSDFIFLPERFALSPIVPAYRYGDQTFGLIVDWTMDALIEAEASGITDHAAECGKRNEARRHAHRTVAGATICDNAGFGSGARLGSEGDRGDRQLRRDLSAHDRRKPIIGPRIP
jgi:hypothetical protein